MTLVRVNPRKKVKRSNSIFDNLFNELIAPGLENHVKTRTSGNKPAVNIIEKGESFQIEIAVPGLSKKDIAINVEKDVLTVEANKEVETPEGEKFIKRGFNFNTFKRTFRLPETIDTSKIDAAFKNGILNLSLAKKEEAKEQPPRTIAIQ